MSTNSNEKTISYNASEMSNVIVYINKADSSATNASSKMSKFENIGNISDNSILIPLHQSLSKISTHIEEVNPWKQRLLEMQSILEQMLGEDEYLSSASKLMSGGYNKIEINMNGIKGYLYLPAGMESVEGLPLIVALGGAGTARNMRTLGTDKNLISSLLESGYYMEVAVFVPLNTTGTWNYELNGNRLFNTIDTIVKDNRLDSSRVSLYGHSAGGLAAYKLVAAHPHYFSTCVTYSSAIGLKYYTKKLIGSETVFMVYENYGGATRDYNTLNSIGVNVVGYVFGADHNTPWLAYSPQLFADMMNIRFGETHLGEDGSNGGVLVHTSAAEMAKTSLYTLSGTLKNLNTYHYKDESYYYTISNSLENGDRYRSKYDILLSQLKGIFGIEEEKVIYTYTVSTQQELASKSVFDRANLTAEDINRLIEIETRGVDSVLTGTGEIWLRAAEETGLDPLFLLAIARNESGLGTSGLAHNTNNFFGMKYQNGVQYFEFSRYPNFSKEYADTIENGIMKAAAWIREFYVDKLGGVTTQGFGKTGYNGGDYTETISNIMNRLRNEYRQITGNELEFIESEYTSNYIGDYSRYGGGDFVSKINNASPSDINEIENGKTNVDINYDESIMVNTDEEVTEIPIETSDDVSNENTEDTTSNEVPDGKDNTQNNDSTNDTTNVIDKEIDNVIPIETEKNIPSKNTTNNESTKTNNNTVPSDDTTNNEVVDTNNNDISNGSSSTISKPNNRYYNNSTTKTNNEIEPPKFEIDGDTDVPYNQYENNTPNVPSYEPIIEETPTKQTENLVFENSKSSSNAGKVVGGILGAAAVAGAGYVAYQKLDEEKEDNDDEYVETKYYTEEDFETNEEESNENEIKVVADPVIEEKEEEKIDYEKEQKKYYEEM